MKFVHPMIKIILISLVTMITLAGSVIVIFVVVNLLQTGMNGNVTAPLVILGFASILLFPTIGGGLWGYAIAKLLQHETKPLVKSRAISWGLSVFLGAIALLLFNLSLGIYYKNVRNPIPIWQLFMWSFALVAGVLAAINTRGMLAQLERNDKDIMAILTGIGAFLTFMGIVILMHNLGWRIGEAPFKPYKMTTVTLISNLGASLVGGTVMGWRLMHSHQGPRPLLKART